MSRRTLRRTGLLVLFAAVAAVLTVVKRQPNGLFTVDASREVRAAPGDVTVKRHDLSNLRLYNLTLARVKDRYVDSTRINAEKMLFESLNSVQYNIPEVLVEPDEPKHQVTVVVGDKKQVFSTVDVTSPWRLLKSLRDVMKFIEANMNPGADLAEVEYAAINGMLSTLDPHSNLMDPEAARDMDVRTSGKFGGLGIVIRMVNRKLTVIKPMKGTPAWRAGVKAKDHIVKIGNQPTDNLTSDESVDRMRGDPGTPVTLWVAREGQKDLLRFDIVRDLIRVTSVESKLLDKNVGVIRVKEFSGNTAAEVAEAIDTLSAQGAKAWVLDLRWNPGGLLEQSVRLVDLFVSKGAVVTTVSSRRREVHDAEAQRGDSNASLAVLVNGGSASASEIVAGALKNLDRAVVIGTKTFGKGSVQELYDNDDGSKLKLTVAEYLTPGDRSIQSVGIQPDIELRRMLVPDKNDAPGDYVRMLAPSRSYGEKDLDAHLTSKYEFTGEAPAHALTFLVETKAKPAAPADGEAPLSPEEQEEEAADVDEITEDFEIKFAKDLVCQTVTNKRSALLKLAPALVEQTRAAQDKALIAKLGALAVDWTTAKPATGGAKLSATITSTAAQLKAGDIATLTVQVTNNGDAPAYRVLARAKTDNYYFEDSEFPIGKLEPGTTKTFATKIKVPKDAVDRLDRITLEIREANGAVAMVTPTTVRTLAADRPTYAYAYQLQDTSGDGLPQIGEAFKLRVTIKNIGKGTAKSTTVLLRNASGDGVVLDKSRFELGEMASGASNIIEFPFRLTAHFEPDELALELMMSDSEVGASAGEKLKFPMAEAAVPNATSGLVSAKGARVSVRSGASDISRPIGYLTGSGKYQSQATVGNFTRIDLGSGRVGFVLSRQLKAAAGTASPALDPYWNSTPPEITVDNSKMETTGATYRLRGQVKDDVNVADVYAFVSNSGANIDGRKVMYTSGKKAGVQLPFDAEIPLWPGSNSITIVARENSDVRSYRTFVVYRDVPAAAAK